MSRFQNSYHHSIGLEYYVFTLLFNVMQNLIVGSKIWSYISRSLLRDKVSVFGIL